MGAQPTPKSNIAPKITFHRRDIHGFGLQRVINLQANFDQVWQNFGQVAAGVHGGDKSVGVNGSEDAPVMRFENPAPDFRSNHEMMLEAPIVTDPHPINSHAGQLRYQGADIIGQLFGQFFDKLRFRGDIKQVALEPAAQTPGALEQPAQADQEETILIFRPQRRHVAEAPRQGGVWNGIAL